MSQSLPRPRLATAAALAFLFALPAAAQATQTTFGSDLSGTPSIVFNDVRQVFQTTKHTGSAVGVTAPQTGVIVKIKIKVNNNASGVKYRIMTGPTSPGGSTYTARTAFASGTASVSVTGGAISTYSPVDGSANPVGVPITQGEYIAVSAPASTTSLANNQAGGKYVFGDNAGDHASGDAVYDEVAVGREVLL